MSTFHIGCTVALCLPEILRCVFRRFYTSSETDYRSRRTNSFSDSALECCRAVRVFALIPYGAVLEDIKFAFICFRGSTAACCCWSFRRLNSHSSTFVGPHLLLSPLLSTVNMFPFLPPISRDHYCGRPRISSDLVSNYGRSRLRHTYLQLQLGSLDSDSLSY
jgi:hypothetical protein